MATVGKWHESVKLAVNPSGVQFPPHPFKPYGLTFFDNGLVTQSGQSVCPASRKAQVQILSGPFKPNGLTHF